MTAHVIIPPTSAVQFRPMRPVDAPRLHLQRSQHVCLGVTRIVHSIEDGRELVEGGPAWTAERACDGRVLCIAGFKELWPGRHAVAWAMLATGLGPAHLAITRYARDRIAEAPFDRIEAIVREGVSAECRWARLVGLTFIARLRKWGPDGETHVLFERIRGG